MADQVPPTRMALQTYKTKRTGATKGHQLLKKKADALKARFQGIAKEIYATKATMADACGAAFFSLTAAQYAAGDFKNKVLEGSFEASCRIEGRTDNIAGVKIPVFRRVRADVGTDHLDTLGLGGGKVDLIKDWYYLVIGLDCLINVGEGLCFNALAGIDHK